MGVKCHGHDHSHDHGHSHTPAAGSAGRLGHAVKSLVVPDTHDVADSTDDALEGSRQWVRAVVVSLVLLLITAGLQLLVVALSSSIALFSDALHDGADAMTAVPCGSPSA
jgi:Co/Zn/Cd efflux system component